LKHWIVPLANQTSLQSNSDVPTPGERLTAPAAADEDNDKVLLPPVQLGGGVVEGGWSAGEAASMGSDDAGLSVGLWT
jgi:hypothetical protein